MRAVATPDVHRFTANAVADRATETSARAYSCLHGRRCYVTQGLLLLPADEAAMPDGARLRQCLTTAVYRSHLHTTLPPIMRPQTLADATQTAATLPARLGVPLVDSARSAFTQGFHLAAVVSAALALLLALIAATAAAPPATLGERLVADEF
jgi:hypothetical protein